MLSEFSHMATLYIRLKEIVAFLSKTTEEGLIAQSFAIAVSDYLQSYHESLLGINSAIASRRKVESRLWGKGIELHPDPTLNEIYVFVLSDFNKLKIFASLCGCDIMENKKESSNFSNRNYMNFDKSMMTFVVSHWISKMNKGIKLLNHIYIILAGVEHDLRYADLLRVILKKSALPLFEFLARCVYNGEVIDPFSEFFIKIVDNEKSRKLELDYKKVPIFLGQYVEGIFRYYKLR